MKITFPSLRIESSTKSRIQQAVKKYNETSLVKMTVNEFRRIAYEYLSQLILQDKKLDLNLI